MASHGLGMGERCFGKALIEPIPVVHRGAMVTRRWNGSDAAKSGYVNELFSALAPRYDAMTDVWTFGLHRLWKRQAMELCPPKPGERVLDVATGTGDLAFAQAAAVGPGGQVVGVDACAGMLDVARQRQRGAVEFQEGDATDLEFPDGTFDIVTSATGYATLLTGRRRCGNSTASYARAAG